MNYNYAKITAAGGLEYATLPIIKEDGSHIFTTDETIYNQYGYYFVDKTTAPSDAPEGQHYERSGWMMAGSHIIPVWTLVEDPLPAQTMEEQVAALQAEMDALLGEEADV